MSTAAVCRIAGGVLVLLVGAAIGAAGFNCGERAGGVA